MIINKNIKKIVSIRFKNNEKLYNFDCKNFVLKIGDDVIVQTKKGLILGTVYKPPKYAKIKIKNKYNLNKIFKKVDIKNIKHLSKNKIIENQSYKFCKYLIKKINLKMNLFSVESTFDSSRLTFFFTANGRIDFRELVKNLIKKFKTRIEMRQVGVRNKAKICGGIGQCGQVLCCSSFLKKFEPISIKMAKRQGLSLNPTKISGQCGRLMCCLTFEDTVYKEIKKQFNKNNLN